MIVQEVIEQPDGGWTLVRTYSDAGMKIRQDEAGYLYDEAVDPQFVGRTYTETDIPIASDDEEPITEPIDAETQDLIDAARILFGEVDE